MKNGKLFGNIHCDIDIPDKSSYKSAHFPPFFKTNSVMLNIIGDLMKNYADKDGFLSQPRKMLSSGLMLQNGILIVTLFFLYLEPIRFRTKTHRIFEYIPNEWFNCFLQSASSGEKNDEKCIELAL